MRKLLSILALGTSLVVAAGCAKKPQTDYSGLDQSGMWSTSLDELKKLKVSDMEIAQLTKLKQSGASDDLCLSLLKAARAHHHDFSSAESAIGLSRAGYSDPEILEMAKTDQIDLLAGEAVMLKLIGLSNPTVQAIMHRRMQGLSTPTSEQIEAFIHQREVLRNHANTSFVKVQGRRR